MVGMMLFPAFLAVMDNRVFFKLTQIYSVPPQYAIKGLVLMAVGLIVFLGGYCFGLNILKPLERIVTLGTREITQYRGLVFYILTVFLRLIRIWTTGINFGAESSSWGALENFDKQIKRNPKQNGKGMN